MIPYEMVKLIFILGISGVPGQYLPYLDLFNLRFADMHRAALSPTNTFKPKYEKSEALQESTSPKPRRLGL